jgi:hypothetical protein
MNEMEQRLMSYILSLEEKVSETTFRNHDLTKQLETFRNLHTPGEPDNINPSQRSDAKFMKEQSQENLTARISTGSCKELYPGSRKPEMPEEKSSRQHPANDSKTDSIISFINLEVSTKPQ